MSGRMNKQMRERMARIAAKVEEARKKHPKEEAPKPVKKTVANAATKK
jgi:hypothetical protein